ncbi:MAG: S1 family peptidase [Planctomycetaceae bacterium]|nr:S1 family peptidase [Planctomycetaceae bacterium]
MKFFNPESEYFTDYSTDVDFVIRKYLAAAMQDGATDEQIGRLNAVFESVVGLMRGGANDIFTTRIDKGNWNHTTASPVTATSSDANVTSTRDGVNAKYYIVVPNYTSNRITGGNLILGIWREFDVNGTYETGTTNGAVTVTVPIGIVNNNWSPTQLQTNIFNLLNSRNPDNGTFAANDTSNILVPIYGNGNFLSIPAAQVNYYAPGEFDSLYGDTPWALPSYYYSSAEGDVYDGYHVYEIIFTGASHDSYISMGWANGTTLSRDQMDGNVFGSSGIDYYVESYGYSGSAQMNPGLSVLPNGSYVASWFTNVTSTNGTIVDRKINYRYFQESTDSTGPHVTDVVLPNGEYVPNNGHVAYNLNNLVVTFDKELLANSSTAAHSVTNPNNWALMKDGVEVKGAIQEIQFGMNIARDFISDDSELAGGVLSHGSNKWEAVITFNTPLGSGSYELVAKSNITDTTGVSFNNLTGKYVYGNGNPLSRNVASPNGENFTRLFNIVATNGLLTFATGNGTGSYDDLLVSDIQGEHFTRTSEANNETASNPTSVACDDQGNFVTVWTAEGNGIWAKIYRQEFVETENGRGSVVTVYREFQVTNNPTATYASVAMDADGDFVVTWVQNSINGTDIYARAYNANGTSRTDENGNAISEFKVNSHETGIHNFPDIAMDSTGSFVITWESLNQVNRNSGYDIYYQRYDSACNALGGTDEIQAIQFVGNPTIGSTFSIEYEGRVTAAIPIGRNTTITAESIQTALNSLGLDVEVQAYSSSTILVQFGGLLKEKNVSQLNVIYYPSKSTQAITASTLSDGASGESRANDTTVGDKRYPSIDMAQDGSFIITWTSWGQGNDRPYETNIYAKNFSPNSAIIFSQGSRQLSQRIQAMQASEQLGLKIVSADAIDNHLTGDNNYTGVVRITAGDGTNLWMGSGSLLVSGSHILTAAHVVTTETGDPVPVEDILVTFVLPSGNVTYKVSQNSVHPDYAGDPSSQTDLAVLTLETIAPAEAERYDIYRGNEEIGSVFEVVGFGTTGTGTTGNIGPAGTRHEGQNKYEALGSIFGIEYSENTLVYDFDDGTSTHDALGIYFNIRDTGLNAAYEATSAQGDSGGPGFISGKIAGVVSYGGPMYENSKADIDSLMNCSFGEFSVDVRVSAYGDWIDTIVATGTAEYLVNETEIGNQMWSDVAISMTNEVIFTWTSFGQDSAGDGPGGTVNGLAGVYARRFNIDGTPVVGSIGGVVVTPPPDDTDTPDPGDEVPPDDPPSDDEPNAPNAEGDEDEPPTTYIVGSVSLGGEFLVNDVITDNQWYSSVSIANNGDFMIVWESKQDANQIQKQLPDTGHGAGGVTTETVIDYGVYGKRYTSLATLMQSRDNTNNVQYGIPDETRYVPGYGYVGMHGEFGREFRINKDNVYLDQTGATVTLNANGDAIVVFQGETETSSNGYHNNVYYRVIPRASDTAGPIITETVVVANIPLDANGKPITGTDAELQYDANGQLMTRENDLLSIQDGSVIYGLTTRMIVTFSEEMYNAYIQSPQSILNPANWQLQRNGVDVYGIISKIDFGKDKTYELGLVSNKTGKWEAVITFDMDTQELGNQPLTSGRYKLTIRENATDNDLNKLDGDYSGLAGGNFTREFIVVAPLASNEKLPVVDEERPDNIPDTPDPLAFDAAELGDDKPAIASAEDGSFVVVSVHYAFVGTEDFPGSSTEPWNPNYPTTVDENGILTIRIGNIVMQRFDKNGNKIGTTKIVNNYMNGDQSNPDIAMDSYGNTAIVWNGAGPTSNSGVFLRIYDAYGEPLIDQLMVNASSSAQCLSPKVAYDESGNIFVTWIEYNAATKSNVMKGRVFTADGTLQQTSLDSQLNVLPGQIKNRTRGTEEFVVVSENGRDVVAYDIAFDNNSNLVLTWQMHNPSSNSEDIYAKVLKYENNTLKSTNVGTFIVNTYTTGRQFNPTIAVSDSGTFVVTWTSDNNSATSYGQYEIFARRFNTTTGAALSILGTTADALINTRTIYSQEYSDVSMSSNGNFVITWTSYDQEPNNFDPVNRLVAHDKGTFARVFSNDGTDLIEQYVPLESSEPGYEWKEFRLNNTTLGNQQYSVATIDNNGMSFAWVGQIESLIAVGEVNDQGQQAAIIYNTSGVFTRTYRVGAADGEQGISGKTKYSKIQTTGGGGYVGQSLTTFKYESLDAAFIEGTNGNDVFEVTVTQSGTVQVKVNGVTKSVAANIKDLQIDGLGGNDKIIFTTPNENNTALVNAGESRVSVYVGDNSLTLSALNVESAELNVGGTNNYVNVLAAGNDTLELNPGSFKLLGAGFGYIGNGFGNITATGKTNSQLSLYDSVGDDALTLSTGKAVMKGENYSNTATGFNRITAYSSFGNDKAVLNGTAGNDSLYVSPYGVSLVAGSSRNSVIGYNNVLVEGNGGVDSAAFVGSKYSDQFTGTSIYAEAIYGTGGKVGVYNYSNFTYNGQGGNDLVSLTDVNYKSSGGNRWEYGSKSQSYVLENVSDVRVIVEVSRVTSSQPQQAAALAADSNDDLYQLLAADNLNSSKPENSNVESNELDVDYLLKTGALDI